MCGITGIYSFGDRDRVFPADCLDQMVAAVRHRGPDGTGRYSAPGLFLGHTRLAVLDPSPAGAQPMVSPDKRLVVSYNGEIYNFRQLRKELEKLGHCFQSGSDTEVLLAAWQEWGEAALDKVEGIFAFALFDLQEQVLFLGRDHMGVKPLFYQVSGGNVFFASEVPALFSAINPPPPPNPADLDSYFTFNYLPAPRTGLLGVQQLLPGCLLRVDQHGESLKRYWRPEYQAKAISWSDDTIDRFKDLLFTSVKEQLVSDVPLGILLSGGLDSYSLALAAVSGGEKPISFTLGFAEPGFDETAAATEYAQYLGIANRPIPFAWHEAAIADTLGAMARELLADPSSFPMYQLSAAARREVSVVLSGDGGDELLAGYNTYAAGMVTPAVRMIPSPLRHLLRSLAHYLPSDSQRYGKRMVVERLMDAAEAGHRRDHASFRRIFSDQVKKRLYTGDFLNSVAALDPVSEYTGCMDLVPDGRSYLAQRLQADLSFHLPSILAQVDRMSMAHGLEVRVPYLSRDMVEFCINLDDRCKFNLLRGKRILRKAIKEAIPRSGLKRPKAGFLPPVDRWFRGGGPVFHIFGDLLATAKGSLDILQWHEVEQFWQEHRQRKIEGGYVLLGILQFINWSNKCKTL